MDQKILLITGGLGYIGSHAVVAFEQAGYKAVIIDNLVNSTRDTLLGIEKILGYTPDFFECDIRNRSELEKIFQKYDFSGVIHFAGLKAVGESCRDIFEYQDNNIAWSIILFWVMEKFWIKKIVFSSSATVYRPDNFSPLNEAMPIGSTNPYGTSKIIIEQLLEDYAMHAGWMITNLRYFNPIGAHSSGNIGEVPNGIPNNLLPYILDVAIGKREKVLVFGDDYDTIDGTGVRDYIDINDLIDAHIIAYEKIVPWCEFYNIGTGKWVSVLEMIVWVEQVSWKKIPYEIVSRRAWDLAVVFADVKRIHTKYNWKTKRTLDESIKNAYKFLLNVRKNESDTKKSRVMHFLPYFPPHSGWVEMYAKEWVENYIIEWGEACIVTFSGWQKKWSRTENWYNVIVLPAFDVVHWFPFPKFWMPSFWIGLQRAKKWNPDILHTHTRFFLSSFLWGIFAKLYHIPWIHIEHGSGFVVSGSRLIETVSRWYDHTLGQWTLSHADEIVAVSEACEHFIRDTFVIKKVRTIYRGITPIATAMKPASDEIHIWFVGRLVNLKWVDVLIRAFTQVQRDYKGSVPLKLQIIGDGPEKKKLEKLSESLTLSESIEFLGVVPIERVRSEFLPSFHIFVNPSFQEWLPTTVIEALIAGCQVVATDVGWTREILRYAPFLLIAPRNIRSLQEAMEKSIQGLDLQSDTRISPSLFLWEQTFREFREIYTQFIK